MNKQTLAKVDFEINVQHIYLKKLSTGNVEGEGVMSWKNNYPFYH